MKTIWKFNIQRIKEVQNIEMPVGAKVLSIQTQRNEAFIWALVDPEAVRENRSFIIYGTGHDINDIENLTYIDTYQVGFMLDILVFHLFEIVS